MTHELLASQGIDVDRAARAAYQFIRQKYNLTYTDETIACSGYCIDAGPQMTARLPYEKLKALGLYAVNVCSRVEELSMVHHYTTLVDRTSVRADIIVDATYGQFMRDPEELVFVGTRSHMIDLIESEGLDPECARLLYA